ncbi:MAG: hypothetical protein CMG74_11920 [Candidatus Marinimicrobia bacterium]|nr:hypothetical protein [Candidatus Neomarinimicrobiota bacterium]|tara:strand:+ start:459 stop:1505 length:1047 start_codon:yes stop_codon:yes gene_type:complete
MDYFLSINLELTLRITLKDIAKDSGVSIATVSRALARTERRYTTTEEKIYRSARKLGYQFIGNDALNDELRIALVTEIHEGEFYSSLFNGFYKASEKTNSEIIFVNLAKHSSDPVQYIIELTKKYSGICLFLPNLDKLDYARLKYEVGQYPIVSLTPRKNPKIDTISFDSYSGGYMVAKHFQELGYTNLGYISGPSTAMDATFRKNGFIDHINEIDDLRLVWSHKGDFTNACGKNAFNNFKNNPSTKEMKNIAIFGCNDHTCFGFIKAAIENKFSIPEDFIIAGYDNLSFCETITPELTSISTDFFELAKKTIRIVENMITEDIGSLGHITMIPVKIIQRNSTASSLH